MNLVDTLLLPRWLIPIQPSGIVYDNYALVIDKGCIVDLLPQDQLENRYCSKETIRLPHHALMPGLVNCHTHSPMTLFRGLADDLPLMDWLNNHIWPAEAKWLNEEFIQDGTRIALAEMIKSGTTCFNEHFFFPEVIAQEVIKSGMRACIGPTIINFPTKWSKDENDAFDKFLTIFNNHEKNERLTWNLAPHAPYTTTDSILQKIAQFSQEHAVFIHMHLHESQQEIKGSLEEYGKRPLQRLYELELLSPYFQAIHMTQVDENDLELLVKTRANVIHCPESNLKLASGNCEVNRLLKAGINVALGTDGAASNNDVDMLGEMQTAALIGKAIAMDATAISAIEALSMATLNGAKALGLDKKIGSLELGKQADVIAIDLKHINTSPIYHPISQIVYSAKPHQVTDVFVAGNPLMRNRQLVTLDEDGILLNANKWQARINN